MQTEVPGGCEVEGQRGRQHWSSVFSHLEALASRPVSAAASSEPGSEISSMMGSGDDVSDKLVISTTGPLVQGSNGVNSNMADNVLQITVAATPLTGAATPLTPSKIQPIVVQLSVQDTPSASGSSCMPLISMPPVHPPLISMPLAAPTATQLAAPTATQPAAPSGTQLAATQLAAPTAMHLLPIMSVRPNQIGFAGASSNFYSQSNQFPYMANPSWEASQREQILQNQLLQERQQFEA